MTTLLMNDSNQILDATETLTRARVRRTGYGQTAPASRSRRLAGRILTGIPVLFLLFDCVIKFVRPPMVVTANAQLGYPPSAIVGLGVVLAICLAIYLFPRSSIVGAVLLTGYLGGAIASHVRVGDPVFSHVLFPIYVAALLWGGLYLRDRRLRALLAARGTSTPSATQPMI